MKIGMTPERRVQLKIDGGYDKHGDVFVIARPLTGSVSFPVKTFDDAKVREQFIEEFTFFRYGGQCPSWHSVLFANDCFSDEEKYSDTLKGKSYTSERGRAYVLQLIASGELVVHEMGSWIPPGDRNHHLPWPKSSKKEEFLPVKQQPYTLGPHEEPGYVPPDEREPRVSIVEAPLVEWAIPESGESDSLVLHAVGTPSGGTYAWTGVDKKVCSLSTLLTGQNIEIKPVGEGSFKASVSYDFQGKVAKAVVEVKIEVVPDYVPPMETSTMLDGKVVPDKVESFSTNAAFDGKLYPSNKIEQLVPYLEKRGVTVMETRGNPSFTGNWDGTGVMKLPANPTELQVKHELSHFIDFRNQIKQAPTVREGVQGFVDMGRLGREQSVLDHLQNNRVWNQLNNAERSFSIDYVERLRIGAGQ